MNTCQKLALLRDRGILVKLIDWVRYEILKCWRSNE